MLQAAAWALQATFLSLCGGSWSLRAGSVTQQSCSCHGEWHRPLQGSAELLLGPVLLELRPTPFSCSCLPNTDSVSG